MNIDLVREASGDVFVICRETGERIQNVMISGYQIRQPHTDINSVNGDRYRITDSPTIQITLETTSDIQITQRAESQPPPPPQRNPFFLPGMDQGEATRELGLGRALGPDSFYNPTLGTPVFSGRPLLVTAPADRIGREVSRIAEGLNMSQQDYINRNAMSQMIEEMEREMVGMIGLPAGVINRNGDSISPNATFNGQPVTAREVPFGSAPDVNSFRGQRYMVNFDRLQAPQYAGPSPIFDPIDMPQLGVRICASVANATGLARANFSMDEILPDDAPTTPPTPVSPTPSLFSDNDIIPDLNEHPASDEIVSTEDDFLAFDSANEVTQELIRMFNDIDMQGIANLLLRASLHGRGFLSEAWSGFTSHLVSEASIGNFSHERFDFVTLMCMLSPEEAWKCFTINADTKNWNEMQWDNLAAKRIHEELSRSSTVCISSKSVENIEPLDILA